MRIEQTFYGAYAVRPPDTADATIANEAAAEISESGNPDEPCKESQDGSYVSKWEADKNLLKQFEQLRRQNRSACETVKTAKPKDSSGYLTRRLVMAGGQFEVRQIIAEASSDLIRMRMLAALSKGEDAAAAKACVRSLEKVIGRACGKIKDLDQEDILKIQKVKAEKKRQEKRAEQIKMELRKKQLARMMRENSYLLERSGAQGRKNATCDRYPQPQDCAFPLEPAMEAAIAAQAEAIAAAEADIAGCGGSAFSGGPDGAPAAEGGASIAEGGDATE